MGGDDQAASDAIDMLKTPVRTIKLDDGAINIVRYNSNGQYFLAGGQNREITLVNPNSGGKIKAYSAHGWEVLDISISGDNAKFASVGGDKAVFLWDVATGKTIKRFLGHTHRVNTVDFNSDATVIASGSYDSSVRIWDCKSQNRMPIQVLEDAKDSISSLQIKNHQIIAGSVDGRLRTYDLRFGQLITDVVGHPITSVWQSSDNNCILVSTLDSTIRLFDKANGGLLQSYKGHKNSEYRIRSCLGDADKFVVSGSEDGRVMTWNLVSGASVAEAPAHNGRIVTCVSYHPTKQQALTSGVDGSVEVWE